MGRMLAVSWWVPQNKKIISESTRLLKQIVVDKIIDCWSLWNNKEVKEKGTQWTRPKNLKILLSAFVKRTIRIITFLV